MIRSATTSPATNMMLLERSLGVSTVRKLYRKVFGITLPVYAKSVLTPSMMMGTGMVVAYRMSGNVLEMIIHRKIHRRRIHVKHLSFSYLSILSIFSISHLSFHLYPNSFTTPCKTLYMYLSVTLLHYHCFSYLQYLPIHLPPTVLIYCQPAFFKATIKQLFSKLPHTQKIHLEFICTIMYIYIYMYVCVCVCVWTQMCVCVYTVKCGVHGQLPPRGEPWKTQFPLESWLKLTSCHHELCGSCKLWYTRKRCGQIFHQQDFTQHSHFHESSKPKDIAK